jgi:hypothetical protein
MPDGANSKITAKGDDNVMEFVAGGLGRLERPERLERLKLEVSFLLVKIIGEIVKQGIRMKYAQSSYMS